MPDDWEILMPIVAWEFSESTPTVSAKGLIQGGTLNHGSGKVAVFGEAVSLALLEVARNERERYHFVSLLQLETETKARLRPLLYKYKVSLSENMALGHIDGIVQGYINSSWEVFAKANIQIVEGFLTRFKEIAVVGPDEDREILESMIRHETAIMRWFDMESRGEKEGSLDGILAELQYPV